jgi:glucose-1-phosphate adenylyltransferase
MVLLRSLEEEKMMGVDPALYHIKMDRVGAIILGGGQGTRLFPLTSARPKPAVHFGGRYRLIDVPISNALNCNVRKIYVLTQFLSTKLNRYIHESYSNLHATTGFVDILGIEQKATKSAWYQGTADAVRQNIEYLEDSPVDYFLVLSGDQLYNMDFQHMLAHAYETEADVLVASLVIGEKQVPHMGILKVDGNNRITNFLEKPKDRQVLEALKSPSKVLDRFTTKQTGDRHWLGSMGIYLFKKEFLLNLLSEDERDDFGKHLLPSCVEAGCAYAYPFDGYWEDIGTIESFFEANLALTRPNPQFKCHIEENPIYSSPHHLPGPKISNANISSTILCEGAIVDARSLEETILGPRTVVEKGTTIKRSYIMGSDYYVHPVHKTRPSVGEDCRLENCIIDLNVQIGSGVELTNHQNLTHFDSDRLCVRDGIIVVPANTILPDGFCF